jgi:hypothetical protein
MLGFLLIALRSLAVGTNFYFSVGTLKWLTFSIVSVHSSGFLNSVASSVKAGHSVGITVVWESVGCDRTYSLAQVSA